MDDISAENNESQPTKIRDYVNGKKNSRAISQLPKNAQLLFMIYLHSFTIIGKSV